MLQYRVLFMLIRYSFLSFKVKVGFCLSEELIRKVNHISATSEEEDGILLTASSDGDRKLVFRRELKVEFSNNTTQVLNFCGVDDASY